jgi:tetratricopeptide (TPR) repeat protein
MIAGRWPTPGQRIGQRYVVEQLAARGGMGDVYRARDDVTGEHVALKVVRSDGASAARLNQEALVLSELRHPAIVRYRNHGQCGPDLTFLAMDWLDGEDLSDRLSASTSGLGVDESLSIVRRIADGLAAVHARGLVHRDVKPSNIRLEGHAASRATLVDFGVACSQPGHPAALAPRATAAGIVLGTVGYMSPEQATGEPNLDPRSDVFALGCVLYECLTGEPAFSGMHVMAILAKVLREQAPSVRELRPELPPALDDLVVRMLAKDRRLRPADASAVSDELARVPSTEGSLSRVTARRAPGLSTSEKRPVSVMLALVPGGAEAQAESVVEQHGGELARLANGGLLVTLSGHGDTHEQVVRATACALALRDSSPAARIGLSTGWASAGGGPPGSLIDHAASLLAESIAAGVRVDEVTAGLLGARFEVRREGEAITLVGRRVDGGVPRTLLGKATPCVGRDRELDLLVATLRECAGESVAHAVVVTGPAGQGKSRLAHELLTQVGQRSVDAHVLCARGDPFAPGSSLTLARQLVQQAARLREGVSESLQRAELAAHVDQACDASDAPWVLDFLAELLGMTPADGAASERFRAACSDARVMGQGLRTAFGAWIAAMCRRRPLLVVVDDLQWGDEPSISYLAEALRTLRTKPLMVLALGRSDPRVHHRAVWNGTNLTEVALPRLGRRAAEVLARTALGPEVDEASISRIVVQGDGNALYVEELVRHVAAGGATGPLPDTVLALAHSRIERLDPAARRIVRAASIFGEACWACGLAALLGVGPDDRDLHHWVEVLVQLEILEPVAESRFADEAQLAFRASLLRDAAYATLTEPDRAKGHLLAGEWLESVGERDALRLAEHFDRSGDRARALSWWTRGAVTALKAGAFEAAVELCNKAKALDPEGPHKGKLLQTEGVALAMRGDLRGCADRLRTAMACFEAGTPQWFSCAATLLLTGTFLGDATITLPLVGAVLDPSVQPDPSGPYGVALYAASVGLAVVGHLDAAEAFLARAGQLAPDASVADPVFLVAVELTRSVLCLARGEIGAAARELARARATTARTGDMSGELLVALHESAVFAEAGDEARCRRAAERLTVLAEGLGAASFADWGTLSVAQVRLAHGEGRDVVAELGELVTRLDPMFVAFARAMLSQAYFACGDMDAAERTARKTCDDASMFPGAQAAALGTLARVVLRRGDAAVAFALAEQGIGAASRVGSPRDVSILLLVRVEALAVMGRRADEASALAEARDRILRIAASIDDELLREAYVTRVEANAATLARARRG